MTGDIHDHRSNFNKLLGRRRFWRIIRIAI